MRGISRRLGLRVEPTVLQDGSQAIDVDNDRTYKVVEELMAKKQRHGVEQELARA